MEALQYMINIVLHLDQYLATFVAMYGAWVYGLLFLIIFCETGLIILPFLPGDSLLFAVGALAANSTNTLNIHVLFVLLVTASILGNGLNYWIGRLVGPRIFASTHSRLFNRQYLEKAHAFYEKYGNKAIIIARFMPIIRTFAPFVAGIGYMSYRKFALYNAIGAFLWIGGLLYLSYLFGNIPVVQEHFSTVVLLIIIISILPAIFSYLRLKFTNLQTSRQNIQD